MTHLPFIAASYALGVLIPAGFALSAFLRMGAARRKLAAIDPRLHRPGAGPTRQYRQDQDARAQPGSAA